MTTTTTRDSFELFHSLPSPTALSFPPLYGEVEDEMMARRVCVSPTISSSDFKKLVHKLYCEVYDLAFPPSSLRLYTRFDVDVVEVKGESKFRAAITSKHDCLTGTVGKTSKICVIVSRHHDDTLKHLLILPAIFPTTHTTLQNHTHHQLHTQQQQQQLNIISSEEGDCLFPPLPLPVHIDDWVAQYRDDPQTVSRYAGTWCERTRRKNKTLERDTIQILPIAAPTLTSLDPSIFGEKKSSLFPKKLLDDLSLIISAFFDNANVEVLPVHELTPKKTSKKSAKNRLYSPKGVDVEYRYEVPATGQKQKQGQLSCPDLLECVASLRLIGARKSLCVLGVTLVDTFCSMDDTFTIGLASIDIGVFSFYRYLSGYTSSSSSSSYSPYQTLLARAAKTAVHEICHMFGVAHCVHRSCCMNGSGHLLEDFNIPMGLCPVCIGKLACYFGENFSLISRSEHLISAYKSVGLPLEIEHEDSVLKILNGEKIEKKEKEKTTKKRKKTTNEEGNKGRGRRRKIEKEEEKEEEEEEEEGERERGGEEYEKKTVVELRKECRRRGLMVSGRKKELILRLEKDDN